MNFKIFLLVLTFASCKTYTQSTSYDYPKIEKQLVKENIHGIEVTDEFRNLENTKDTLVNQWYRNQSGYSKSFLDSIGLVDSVYSQMTELRGRTKTWAKWLKVDEKNNTFYVRRRPGEKQPYVLFYRNPVDNKEVELYHPDHYKPNSGVLYKISYIKPSWNGEFVAIALNHSKNFDSEIVVLDMKTKKLTADLVINTSPAKFGGINWLPDDSGFTYLYFPVVKKGEEGYKANSSTALHILGSENSKIKHLFGKEAGINLDNNLFPMVRINSSEDKYIMGFIVSTTRFTDTYYASVSSIASGKPDWKYFFGASEKINLDNAIMKGDTFYYMTAKQSPNFRINSIDMNNVDFENPKAIVEESKYEVLTNFEVVSNGLYCTKTKNGVKASLYFKSIDSISEAKVEFPFMTGTIMMVTPNMKGENLLIETDGWANDLTRYNVVGNKLKEQIILAEIPHFPEFENLVAEEILVKGHDGESIPVSLIYDSEKPLKNMPTLIKAYGAYGKIQSPYFSPNYLTWVARGGILVHAHVRGGGEKGQNWHDQGRKSTKSNTWKDVISVTEELINRGYTASDKTALWGISAGGIATGMAMIERPDLFKVVVNQIPLLNPSRLTSGSYKQSSYMEFGRIDDPNESKSLLAMDPYLNLEKNVNYPTTLLISSGKDDRLNLYETGKFIAKLQDNQNSTNPYLLNIDFNGVHSSSSTKSLSKVFGFTLWAINDKNLNRLK